MLRCTDAYNGYASPFGKRVEKYIVERQGERAIWDSGS